jgi:hypothetical protein
MNRAVAFQAEITIGFCAALNAVRIAPL